MTVPTVDDIDRITGIDNAVIRNLQITQCYFEISQSIAAVIGLSANWCTFATWASKQAGQTIRQEDLIRAFEERFHRSAEISAILEKIVSKLASIGPLLEAHDPRKAIFRALNPGAAFARAGDAVARGNKKVFEEIGREFARFLAAFRNDSDFDHERIARFCAALRLGDPPDGQRFLSEAFTAYCTARFQNGKDEIELMLLGNLCAGYHEQIRLQPEILEALNAALPNSGELKTTLLRVLLNGFSTRARSHALRRRLDLDLVFNQLIEEVNRLIRQIITEHLMTLHLSGREVLRLGRDLPGLFPQVLGQISHPRLREILLYVDTTPDDLKASGAEDWADFKDRMHFIADFFRVYQDRQHLFEPPFTPEQVVLIKSGLRPHGPL
ncbi:MAG TPA: hypothetical protein VHM64_23620 [Candidatus Binatia bacterium]|nr:hypothetical protein [Candidatus Binatia bacterium]